MIYSCFFFTFKDFSKGGDDKMSKTMKILKAGFGLVQMQYSTSYRRELSRAASVFYYGQENDVLVKKLKDYLKLEDDLRSRLVSASLSMIRSIF